MPEVKGTFHLRLQILFLLLFVIFFGCRVQDANLTAGNSLVLMTAIEPHAFLVERIGGTHVRVEVLVPVGKEPEHFETTPETIARLARSRVFFRTGMPFEERLLPRIKELCPDVQVVDLREGLVLRTLELHSHGEGASQTGHEHHVGCSHDGLDPHIWFAPTPLKKQAETVLKTLLRLDSRREEEYRKNYDRLLEELESTRAALEARLSKEAGKTVFVFHPSYGYFCDEFGLKQRAIEFEGRSPKPQQLAELITEAKETFRRSGETPIVFVQPEFNRAPAEALAESIGARLIEHSCLDRNVLASMTAFAASLSGDDMEKR